MGIRRLYAATVYAAPTIIDDDDDDTRHSIFEMPDDATLRRPFSPPPRYARWFTLIAAVYSPAAAPSRRRHAADAARHMLPPRQFDAIATPPTCRRQLMPISLLMFD